MKTSLFNFFILVDLFSVFLLPPSPDSQHTWGSWKVSNRNGASCSKSQSVSLGENNFKRGRRENTTHLNSKKNIFRARASEWQGTGCDTHQKKGNTIPINQQRQTPTVKGRRMKRSLGGTGSILYLREWLYKMKFSKSYVSGVGLWS